MNKQEIEKALSYWSEFKAEIKDLRKQNSKVDWDEQEKAVDLAIEALEQQLTNGWIPMSVRYPKPKEYSEVWITNINECVSHAYFSDGNFRFDNYGGKAIAREWIIAWKPYAKPEPYKEVSE